jgi:hypothetical protein
VAEIAVRLSRWSTAMNRRSETLQED